MARKDPVIIVQNQKMTPDTIDQLIHVATGKIRPAHAPAKEGIAGEDQIGPDQTDPTPRMPGSVTNGQKNIVQPNRIAIRQQTVGGRQLTGAPIQTAGLRTG